MTILQLIKLTRVGHFGILAVTALMVMVTQPALADFESGWIAYQKGDFRTALGAWRPLAQSGDPRAQFNLGHLYDEGKGVTQDAARAVEWWRKAAEQGFVDAQINLANSMSAGDGVKQDFNEAAAWLARAAESGSARSQYKLGKMFSYGIGVPKNHTKAFEWIMKAASSHQIGRAHV